MSSPITFSGFNNIDFNSVLSALMTQASQPLTTLQSKQKALQTQISSFDTLSGRVAALRSAADKLSTLSAVSTMAGTSSSSAVAVSVAADATAAHYDVVVNELARAQVTVSSNSAPDANTTAVTSGGTITIGGVAVTVTGNTTLQGLANAINNTDGIGVSATVVRANATTYRLALTSTVSGAANAFTVTSTLGSGIQFTDTNNDGISGDSAADNAVSAADASILINNVAATNSTNTFENVVTGVTLTVTKKDPDAVISVDVKADGNALATKIESFISAYNETVSYLEAQRVSAGNGDLASIGRDPVLRQLRNELRTQLVGAHGSAAFTKLAEVGVEFTRDGKLSLDRAVFNEAVATNGDDVRQFLAGTGGAFPAIETALDSYTNAAGYFHTAKDRLNRQIDLMDNQIAAMQTRLQLQREMLQQQFTEADTAMSRLKSQSGSLANLGS
jgi:flagellar hook-associated protein 2